MADTRETLCTICARGGSKGVPRKNVRQVGGKPLIAHTIQTAKEWGAWDDLVVSTDDDEIAAVARGYGAAVPFDRPPALASDSAPKLPVVQHALEEMESASGDRYEYVVDLDPTAPLRTVGDIEDCFATVRSTDATNAYTVTEADKNPYFNMVELDENGYATLCKTHDEPITGRQEAPPVFAMNASIYVFERDFLMATDTVHGDRTRVSEMPPERSIDIDTELDLRVVELQMERALDE